MLDSLYAKILTVLSSHVFSCVLWSLTLWQVRLTMFGRGPQLLLWTGSWATSIKIIISGVPNCVDRKFIHIIGFCYKNAIISY
jgi:hypothetical protein